MPYSHGVGTNGISFDPKRKKFLASFIVTDDLTKQPLDDVKLLLMSGCVSSMTSIQGALPEVKQMDVEAHFRKMTSAQGRVTFTPFADGYSTEEDSIPVIRFQ